MQSPPNRCETFWVLGVQEKYSLQMEVQQERIRAEEAQGFLGDANSRVENLEGQLTKMINRMRKVAVGLHLAINPHQEVRQNLLCLYFI